MIWSGPDIRAQQSGRLAQPGQLVGTAAPPHVPQPADQFHAQTMVENRTAVAATPTPPPGSNARINTVTPVQLGTSTNVFGGLRGQQNQVFANDSLDEVLFIHRQDITIWGGGPVNSGMFRYDASIDGGQSFTPDIGVLNPIYSRSGRYPNISGYNPGTGNNPLQTKAVYTGPTVVSTTWDGFVGGVTDVSVTQSPPTTEAYLNTPNGYLPGGLCQGLPGEFWMVDHLFDQTGGSLLDTIRVYKGVWNTTTSTVDWAIHTHLVPNWNTSFDGDVHAIAPNISFSPDGQIGWIGLLGDLVGGADSVFNPIFIKSTDGGATWGNATEVNLATNPWVYDSLRTLWVDSMMNPVSTGRPTCTFEFDLVVDSAGNPHMAAVVASASTTSSLLPGYTVYSGLAKFMVDVTSLNGGTNFLAREIAPVLTFRGSFGGGSSITLDNCPQISRSADGDYIFYCWVDSDTSQFTGSMAGIGFGESANLAPNLMIAGSQVSTGFQTLYRGVTNGDLIWDGRALRPTMAPEVLQDDTVGWSCFKLPIVVTEMVLNDPLAQTRYWYFGNDANFSTQDFVNPASLNLAWNNPGTLTFLSCNLVPAFNEINGVIWADTNGNAVFDPGEVPVAGQVVQASPGPWFSITDANGAYSIRVPVGNFTVSTPLPLYYTQTVPVTPPTYAVSFGSLGNVSNGHDFGQFPTPNMDDLVVSLAHHQAIPTINLPHYIRVKNVGTTTQVPTLTYQHDSLFDYLGAVPTPASYNAATYTATWTLAALAPGQEHLVRVDLDTPPWAMLGDTTLYYASVNLPANEQTPNNNQDTTNSAVLASWDPNDKLVRPAGAGPQGGIPNNTWLEYTVRFQNTGTAPASLVVIRDSLSNKLDVSTFQTLGASHPHQLSLSGPGYLEWRFPNINLPDSATNFLASQGQVRFRIKPKAGLALGTQLENKASIYFDFNQPVVTNITLNTIDHPTAVTPAQADGQVLVYPNPFEDRTTFLLQDAPTSSYSFELYDLKGQKVWSESGLLGDRYILSRGVLPVGMYFFRFAREGSAFAQGKVMVQ